ncbi:AMP-binding protein [Streptomyces sp. NPDC005953]|uniref:AMP-binding protein n=1 Tax=Streptomyces sp. NPDC005953 TaxID=3156719 RepID=UPI0033E032F5
MDLFSRFNECADRHSDLIAVAQGDDSITYGELSSWSRALAMRARSVTGAGTCRVGVWPNREIGDYAAYLAVLAAGATAVPLNPDFPVERNRLICEQVGLDSVITPSADTEIGLHSSIPLVTRSRSMLLAPGPAQVAKPDDVAYITFTSGSTGIPKGVSTSHRNAMSYLDCVIERYPLGPGYRLSQTFNLAFDGSTFDIFAALSTGATAVLPRQGDLLDPVRYVNEQRLTHWYSVPSVVSFARRLDRLDRATMPGLTVTQFVGEPLTLEQAGAWADAAPSSVIENVYGPTEGTVTCTAYRMPEKRCDWPKTANGTVPIGLPHKNVEVAVHDGELLLRGAQRFNGYLNPDDDRGRFLPDDSPITPEHWYRTGDRVSELADGTLMHLGRLDQQVKLNGYRIELGDIEMALRLDRRILDCVVLAVPGEGGLEQLHAVYCGEPMTPTELIRTLRSRLPEYMIPRRFTLLPELPLTANGKIDRFGLKGSLSSR